MLNPRAHHTPRLLLLLLLLLAAPLLLLGCPGEPEPEPPGPTTPTQESCMALRTQQACFDAGCAFFTNAAPLTGEGAACMRGPSFGLCLHAPEPDGDPLLTTYQRTDAGGQRVTVQLNVDVVLPGWTRCGHVAVPPDCDCDGVE